MLEFYFAPMEHQRQSHVDTARKSSVRGKKSETARVQGCFFSGV